MTGGFRSITLPAPRSQPQSLFHLVLATQAPRQLGPRC